MGGLLPVINEQVEGGGVWHGVSPLCLLNAAWRGAHV